MVKSSPSVTNTLVESPELIEECVALLASEEMSTAVLSSKFLSTFTSNSTDACLLLLSPNKVVLY